MVRSQRLLRLLGGVRGVRPHARVAVAARDQPLRVLRVHRLRGRFLRLEGPHEGGTLRLLRGMPRSLCEQRTVGDRSQPYGGQLRHGHGCGGQDGPQPGGEHRLGQGGGAGLARVQGVVDGIGAVHLLDGAEDDLDDGEVARGVAAGVVALELVGHQGDPGGYLLVVLEVGGGGGGEAALLLAVHYFFRDVGGGDAGAVADGDGGDAVQFWVAWKSKN